MSNNYKRELDKIVMTEDMKKRVLYNVLSGNVEIKSINPQIKKHKMFTRSMLIISVCFTIALSLNAVNKKLQLSKYKYHNDSLKQKYIHNTNKNSQNRQASKVYNDYKKYNMENKNSQSNNKPKEYEVINPYVDDNKNYKESDFLKHNEINILENSDNKSNSNNENNKDNKENNKDNKDNNKVNSPPVTCESQVKEYKTLEEAEGAIKVEINHIKEIPNGFNLDKICVVENSVIEVEYSNGKDTINFTAGKGIDNVDNDSNTYKIENICKVNEMSVKLEESKNKTVNLATWKNKGISYSISSENGIDEEILLNIIKSSL